MSARLKTGLKRAATHNKGIMNGIDAVKGIISFDPQAKILMVSAMGQQFLVKEAIQAGAKDFMVKPFQPAKVVAALKKIVGKK